MTGEILIGLIAIAVGIAAGLSPIWYILRGESKKSKNIEEEICKIRPLLTDLMSSGVDEKISVIYTYELIVNGWERTVGNQLEYERKQVGNKMKSDIRSLGKFKSVMTPDQKESLINAVKSTTKAMRDRASSALAEEIENTFDAIFTT
jgi:hypothetical protein